MNPTDLVETPRNLPTAAKYQDPCVHVFNFSVKKIKCDDTTNINLAGDDQDEFLYTNYKNSSGYTCTLRPNVFYVRSG